MNTYTGIVNAADKSTIYSTMDVLKPEKYSKLYRQYEKQGAEFINTMRLMSRGEGEMPVAQNTFTAYENSWMHENIVIGADAAASAAGGTQSLELETTHVDSEDRYYPRIGFSVFYPDETVGYISDISVAAGVVTLTVQAADTDSLPAVTDGDSLMIGASLYGELTGQPDGVTKKYDSYDYKLMISKETAEISGTQATNMTWFDHYEDGKKAGIWSDAIKTAEFDLDIQMENMAFFGNGLDTTHPTTGASIPQTKGMIRWTRSRGAVYGIAPSAFDYTDLEDNDAYFTSQGNTSPFVSGWVGRDMYTAMSNQFRTVFNTAGVDLTSSMFGEDGREERMVQANFSAINYNNRTWAMKKINTFSNPKTYGTTGYDMSKYAMFTPVSTFEDAKTNMVVPNMCIMHKEKDGYNRAREVWEIKGAGGDTANYNSETDGIRYLLRSDYGLFFPKANQSVLFDLNA